MSLDRSLRSRDALSRHRNVLTRAERLQVLEDEGHWTEDQDSVFGLPKVLHRKLAAGRKTKKKEQSQVQERVAGAGEGASPG